MKADCQQFRRLRLKKRRDAQAEASRGDAGNTDNKRVFHKEDINSPRDSTLGDSGTSASTLPASDSREGAKGDTDIQAYLKDQSSDPEDPLGLRVLYEPRLAPKADIIFIHGLGGTSRRSWSWNRDLSLFWPKEWLPKETDINTARIWSFGYNSQFSSNRDILRIMDFARTLLYDMKFSVRDGNSKMKVGQVPIIFIAHSMGGLIVKKACILGQNDSQYSSITSSIRAIIFLSTPHGGTAHYAELLNRILRVSVKHSRKQYIAELKKGSTTLEEINEQFRHIAPKIAIFSFYETLETAVGPVKIMVLDKVSSTLGYPGEVTKPLNADHHNVCKFSSQEDPGYVSVKNAIQELVQQFSGTTHQIDGSDIVEELRKLGTFLGITDAPVDDCESLSARRMEGSCEWFLKIPLVTNWISGSDQQSRVLLCTGRPGAGKSVLASFVINYLKEHDLPCSYFFFQYGDQLKKSLSTLLKSLSYQIANHLPMFRKSLLHMLDSGFNIQRAESRLIWQKVFTNNLFKIDHNQPVFCVVDALDECEQAKSLVRLLADLPAAKMPIRLLLVSRPTQLLSLEFEKIRDSVRLDLFSMDNSDSDIQRYVNEEMKTMRGDPTFKERMKTRILEKAEGNFLWVSLVLEEILQCHTQDAVEEAINEVPADLEELYQRMDATLAKSLRRGDQEMAKTIFIWATCSKRPLSFEELSRALQPEYSYMLDLKSTISRLCGDFIVVGKTGVSMVHSTAREYLTKKEDLHFFVSPHKAHNFIFRKCVSSLLDIPRSHVDKALTDPFLRYAAMSWPYHLKESSTLSNEESLMLLSEFFHGGSGLTWIYILSAAGELRIVVQAAKVLKDFLKDSDRLDADKNPLTHRLREKDILSSWTTDLVKIVGKFGAHLIKHPKALFVSIPAFCPPKSILYQQVGSKLHSAPQIRGLSNDDWDDCLARFSVGSDIEPLRIMCVNRYFAVLTTNGSVILYHSETCEEANIFQHKERVIAMCFSNNGDKMATYSLSKTIIWSLTTAKATCSVDNQRKARALAISFLGNSDDTLIACLDNSEFRWMSLAYPENGWKPFQGVLRHDPSEFQRNNSPRAVDFSPDGTQVALAYRGLPLSVWALDEPRPRLLGRCEREGDKGKSRQSLQANYTDVQKICWNPATGHILGIFNDGCVFKWHPSETSIQVSTSLAVHIRCSPEGDFFVTGSGDGTLRIWDFDHFALIYQLYCSTPITDLAIGLNTGRILDLRDNFCSVWEPNILLRLAEEDEKASDTLSGKESSTLVSLASESSAEMQEPITALAVDNNSLYYCTGDQDGVFKLFTSDGTQLMKTPPTLMAIENIAWSEDGALLATADLTRRISIMSSHQKETKDHLKELLVIKEDDSICQLLWNLESDLLLVSTTKGTSIWSVKTTKRIAAPFEGSASYYWINHPLEKTSVVGFATDHIRICQWSDMKTVTHQRFDRTTLDKALQVLSLSSARSDPTYPSAMDISQNGYSVTKVFMAPDARHALFEIAAPVTTKTNRRKNKQLMLLPMADLLRFEIQSTPKNTAEAAPTSLTLLQPDILSRIEIPLGFLISDATRQRHKSFSTQRRPSTPPDISYASSESTLAFLDREFWVCTWTWSGSDVYNGRVKRHYFLPQDWPNMECLELATVRSDSALLCPRNGEVAVICNGFDQEWIE
ncbi:hypothetical protein M432DRAFT_587555 [Thermoascus aurantiacus ATCC 26904]